MKKYLAIVGLLFLALAAFICWPRKPKAFSDADLQIVRPTIAANENAFTALTQATNEADFSEEARAAISKLVSDKAWTSGEVAAVLKDYEKALILFDKALELPHLQVPEINSFEEEQLYLAPWKTFAQLGLLKSKALFHAGKEKDAFDLAAQIIRFGHRIEDGTMIHYLVGVAVKQIGFRAVHDLTTATKLSCGELQKVAKNISPYFANETALTNIIKTEYKLQMDTLRKMRAGTVLGSSNTKTERLKTRLLSTALLNEEKTQKIFATFARQQLKTIPLCWSAMPTNAVPPLQASMAKRLISGNLMGQALTAMTLPAQEKFLVRKCRENVDLAATQILLALRCYQMKNGVTPRSLDELIPDFLSTVPLDDFDGKPMRYLPEKKLVYSIGEDLIDSQGQEKDANNRRLDIPFRIEF